ncbi:MAG: sugar transferase, partial [Clostridiales bacterium]|nr:sugar transferase [Clostridiales bacterium]
MKNSSHIGHAVLGALFEISLALVPALLFYYTYIHHYPRANFYMKGNVLFFVVYSAILVLFMMIYGSFSIRKYRTRELVFAFGLSCFFTDVIAYFLMCMIAKALLPPKYVILTLLAQCLIETGVFILARISADRLEPTAPALLIAAEEDAEESVRNKFDRRRTRYSIDRVVSADMPWEKLCEIMHSYTTVVLMPMEKELRRRIMDDCFWHGIAIMLKPDMQDIMVNCADTVIMSDVPLCAVHTGNYDRGYLTAKRVLDIVASVCGLILCSPIFLAVAIAIKIQDGGPVFYRQKRLTLNGKPFYLTKFRSMVVNAESATGAVLAGKSDSRITKVGAFLRATRIDELPQLLNILNGDMTLVGPRPERPEFYQKYCAEYPEFAYRLRAKAGLTGYAQLYGKYNTTFADKALLDMYYIQKASFLWDLQLIFYTLKIIFVKESTEGVETKPAEPEKKEP